MENIKFDKTNKNLINMDKLESLFFIQNELQKIMKNPPFGSQQYINAMSLALCEEVFEALRETNHKPWKTNFGQPLNNSQIEKFREELVDVWHFLINLTLASGMSAQELYDRFIIKNQINHERQVNGY